MSKTYNTIKLPKTSFLFVQTEFGRHEKLSYLEIGKKSVSLYDKLKTWPVVTWNKISKEIAYT